MTSFNLALGDVTRLIVESYSLNLRKLLESKHLYQNTEVQLTEIKNDLRAQVYQHQGQDYDSVLQNWEGRRLSPTTKLTKENLTHQSTQFQVTAPILYVSNVKLFCMVCKGSEVFSPVSVKDATADAVDHLGNAMPRKNQSQLFFLAFQCQRCMSDPDGFIVRRNNQNFYLEGRSPMEVVQVPKYLPVQESRFFSDAIVAFNAGKKLAALFYLRVFLEQFARRVTALQGRNTGEEIMEAYLGTLPVAHRDHMPSFKHWYQKLSAALHDAVEDDQLFEDAKSEIDRHFDIRRIFQISEATQINLR